MSDAAASPNEARRALSPKSTARLIAAGLSEWDLRLVREFVVDFEREKEIARRLCRNEAAVRKQFQKIRKKLGAKNQPELASMLGALVNQASPKTQASIESKDNRPFMGPRRDRHNPAAQKRRMR